MCNYVYVVVVVVVIHSLFDQEHPEPKMETSWFWDVTKKK